MEKLSRNFIWMAAANAAGTFFGTIIFIYLARALQPAAFGRLSYIYAIIFYLINIVDLGLSTYGIREIARGKGEGFKKYVSEIVSFRLLIASIIYVGIVLTVLFIRLPHPTAILFLGAGLALFLSALASEWAFQGIERMHMVFISFSVTPILELLLIYTFIKSPPDLFKVPFLYFLGAFPIIVIFLRRLHFRLKLDFAALKAVKIYLSSSVVIWGISLFSQVYNNLDIVILGHFRTAVEVGYFTIARRGIGGITMLLIFLANALLPRLSCTFSSDKKEFTMATNKFLKLAILIIVSAFLPAVIFSRNILAIMVGNDYILAAFPLSIMIGGLMLVMVNLPYSTGLIAACYEKDVLKQAMGCAALSVCLNLALIPRYGMIGAAMTFLATEAMALAWILWTYNRKVYKIF